MFGHSQLDCVWKRLKLDPFVGVLVASACSRGCCSRMRADRFHRHRCGVAVPRFGFQNAAVSGSPAAASGTARSSAHPRVRAVVALACELTASTEYQCACSNTREQVGLTQLVLRAADDFACKAPKPKADGKCLGTHNSTVSGLKALALHSFALEGEDQLGSTHHPAPSALKWSVRSIDRPLTLTVDSPIRLAPPAPRTTLIAAQTSLRAPARP
jgi:hypothetical protein